MYGLFSSVRKDLLICIYTNCAQQHTKVNFCNQSFWTSGLW